MLNSVNGLKAFSFGDMREFAKLFLAQIFSHCSDAVIQFLFAALILQSGINVGKSIALMFFTFLFPQFLLSTFCGALCDRFSRKFILIFSALYRGIIVLLFITTLSHIGIKMIYVYAFLIGIGAALFYPAKMSAVANTVKSSKLKFANALSSSTGAVALLFGAIFADYLIKGCQVVYQGFALPFSIIAGCYFVSAICSLTIKFIYPQKYLKPKNNTDKKNDLKIVTDYLKHHKKVLYLGGLSVCLQFMVAMFSNTLNSLVTDYYGLSFSDLSYLRTLLGFGILSGMGVALYCAGRYKSPYIFATSFIVLFTALFTSSLCKDIHTAWLWLLPIGISDAVIIVLTDTVLQKIVPDRVRGKIFGLQLTLNTLSFLAGTILAANIVGVINPLTVFKCIAAASVVFALLLLITAKSFRYFLLKTTLGGMFLMFFDYKVEGAENIPQKGKVILAGNHTGHLDPFIVQMATGRNLWFVTGPAAFKVPVIRHFLKYFNVLPLQFGKGLEALDAGINKLNAGEAVIIFPEGKFTPDGNLCKFNRGVGIMAKSANCSVVPFAIRGGFETWGQTRKLPKLFNKIIIQFGQPMKVGAQDEKEFAAELRTRVSFIKSSLERRAFYCIKDELHSDFLELIREKSDVFAQVKALSIKTDNNTYKELSYLEISRLAKKFANYLIETTRVERNERIAIISESRPEFAVGIFASIQTGAITVPLDIKLTVREHSDILNDCKPRILFCSSHYLKHALEVKNNVESIEQIFVLDDEEIIESAETSDNVFYVSKLNSDIEKDLGRSRSLDETALIVYTSGTTGNPKGVMISFGNIYSQLRDFEKLFKLSNDKTLLSVLPLNHLLELNVGFFGMLYMGAKIVYVKSLTPKELTSVMREKGITNMIVVPLVAKMLKNSIEKQIRKRGEKAEKIFKLLYSVSKYLPLKLRRKIFKPVRDGLGGKFECFVSGGAPLEDDVAEFFERMGIPVFQGYGLTETSPTISTNYYGNSKISTVGKPLPSVKVKLSPEGEILVSGSNIMQGYYGKPEMTSEVFDEDGWFKTGDIGEIDKDGYLKITGRIKNIIVLGGGKKIFPEEVEAVLQVSELIKEVCVMSFTVKSGNKSGTEEVGAVLVPADDLLKNSDEEIIKILEDEVKKVSQNALASYKIPTILFISREELPKTSTRKIKRKQLKELYQNE